MAKSVPEALETILAAIPLIGTERVMLLDATGRVLAETVCATRRLPPRDNSAMDGYAVRAADLTGAEAKNPKTLKLVGEVLAGRLPDRALGGGECIRVTTGAPIPEGTDAVVMQERTRAEGDRIAFLEAPDASQNIRFAGEDVEPGEELLEPGCVIGPAQVGLLALQGRSVVEVHRRPVVAILSSGDELVGIDGDTEGWKTVDSNAYTVAAQVRAAGGEPLLLPLAPDDRGKIRELLERARAADVLISTAGVSVGPHDYVRAALEDVGFELSFWRVRQRPGSPLAFGLWQGRPVFGLPGNPVSATVCFEIYARPALLKMSGRRAVFRPIVSARLAEAVRSKPSHTYFLRVRLARDRDGVWQVHSSGLQSSGAVKPLAQGNALVVIPEGRESPQVGEEVPVILLSEDALDLGAEGLRGRLGFAAK